MGSLKKPIILKTKKMIPARGPQTYIYIDNIWVTYVCRSSSTGASREAPVDKWARRHTSIHPYILTIPLAWTCLHLPSPAPSPSSKRFHNKDEQKTILFGVHAQVSYEKKLLKKIQKCLENNLPGHLQG